MVDNDGPKLGGISIKNYRVKKCSEKHVHTKKILQYKNIFIDN